MHYIIELKDKKRHKSRYLETYQVKNKYEIP